MTAISYITMPDRRRVQEWIGKTPDDPFPPKVRLRTLLRFDRKCANCGRTIRGGDKWTCDHVVAIINGGENREKNSQPLCELCNPEKNAADVAEKSKTADVQKAHYGIKDKLPSRLRKPPGTRYDWKAKRYVRIEEATE